MRTLVKMLILFTLVQITWSNEVTVTLQNGLNNYDGCEDISIANPDGASQNVGTNNGSYATLYLVANELCWPSPTENFARVAVKFDLSDIPASAAIEDAELALYLYDHHDYFSHAADHVAYRITKGWQESDASWTSPWDSAGGDYDNTPLGKYAWNGNSDRIWFTFSVTSAVADYVKNPDVNYGFLIINETMDPLSKPQRNYFRSSEYSDEELGPKLTITYEPSTGIIKGNSKQINRIKIKNTTDAVMIYVSFTVKHKLTILDIKGRQVAKIITDAKKQWHRLPVKLSPGMFIVSVKAPNNQIISRKLLQVK